MTRYHLIGAEVLGARMRQMMDRISRADSESGGWSPSVDIYETPEEVVLVAELAGVDRKNVKVVIDGNVVRIYGTRGPTCKEPGARFHRMEIFTGSFVRSFRIGVPIVPDQVEAKAEEGLLYVRLPKEAVAKINVEQA